MSEEMEKLRYELWQMKSERDKLMRTVIRSHRLLDNIDVILRSKDSHFTPENIASMSGNEVKLIEIELKSIGITTFGSPGEKMNDYYGWFGIIEAREFTVVEPAWVIEVLGETHLLEKGVGC